MCTTFDDQELSQILTESTFDLFQRSRPLCFLSIYKIRALLYLLNSSFFVVTINEQLSVNFRMTEFFASKKKKLKQQ